MAISNDKREATAYAANRYAPRPARGPVGKDMSAAQRDLVARLVAQSQGHMRTMVENTPVQGAVTQKMIDECLSDLTPAATVAEIQRVLNQTGVTARTVIDGLIASERALKTRAASIAVKRSAPARETAEDGATYRAPNGAVFHAYKGQQSGRILLKLWDAQEAVFSYYGAASRLPAGSVKLSTEEMQEFGRATGTCAICMRHLENDESVARGIGPICWSKL